ncbi:MAG: hypothetical protein PHC64_11515 [Candidatus Gastranaerophilales bacterium]|nr:hypothetical protein [Candidatus Gastranaerophilales bacterium]
MLVQFQKNNINFTSVPICHVNLPTPEGCKTVKATVSMLIPGNAEDTKAVREIGDSWNETLAGYVRDLFVQNSYYDQSYQALELSGQGDLADRIVGLSSYQNLYDGFNNEIYLSYLVAKPELSAKTETRGIKNIGEALLGAVFSAAQKMKAYRVSFQSENNGFYAKTFSMIGLDIPELKRKKSPKIQICGCNIDEYVEYWQEKFGVDFMEMISEGILA